MTFFGLVLSQFIAESWSNVGALLVVEVAQTAAMRAAAMGKMVDGSMLMMVSDRWGIVGDRKSVV